LITNEMKYDCSVQIPSSHHPYSNCIQDIFVTYLKWKKENYKNLFDDTWTFCFHEGSDWLDIDIYRDNFSQLYNSLYRQFGIALEFVYDFKDYKILLERMYQEFMNGNILGACVDVFYCPWTMEYQKKHNIHFILISGIQKDSVICCDPYSNLNVQYLPIDVFFTTAENMFFINYNKNVTICRRECMLKTIDEMFKNTNKDNDFEQMRKVADVLKNSDCVKDELKLYENVVMCPLLMRINNIGFGRKCFSIYLEEMCRYYPKLDITDIINSLDKIAEIWGRFNMKIAKYSMSGYRDTIMNKLADDIYSISIEEERLALNLKERIESFNDED